MGRPVLKVEIHPKVYEELEESRSWYEEQAKGLGRDFLKEVDRAIETIRTSSTVWPWYDKQKQVRRFIIHRFPFAIIYRRMKNLIQIFAVMHLRRHPDYWKKRLD
jgi:plasmid stabilization system protein ParE